MRFWILTRPVELLHLQPVAAQPVKNMNLTDSQQRLLRGYAVNINPVDIPIEDYQTLFDLGLIEETDSDWYATHPDANQSTFARYQISNKGKAWVQQNK